MKRFLAALLALMLASPAWAGWTNVFSSGPSSPNFFSWTTDGTKIYIVDGNSSPRMWSISTSAWARLSDPSIFSGNLLGLAYDSASGKIIGVGSGGSYADAGYSIYTIATPAWAQDTTTTGLGRIRGATPHVYGSSNFVFTSVVDGTNPASARLLGLTSFGNSLTSLDTAASTSNAYISSGSTLCRNSSTSLTAFWLRNDSKIDYKGYGAGSALYSAVTGTSIATSANIISQAICWPTQNLALVVPAYTAGNSTALVVNSSGTAVINQSLTGLFRGGAVSPDDTALLIAKNDGTVYSSNGSANFADTGIGTPSLSGATIYALVTLSSHVYLLAGDGKAWKYTASPSTSFTADKTTCSAPCSVSFTNATTTVAAPPVTSWSWTFGDSGTSSSQSPTHVYAAAGTYTVALSATNADGSETQTRTNYITVSASSRQRKRGPFGTQPFGSIPFSP